MDDKLKINIQDLRKKNDNNLLSSGDIYEGKKFHSKKFHGISFKGFFLAKADFSQAIFQNVDFTPSTLTNADLTDAKFDPIEGTEIFSTFDLQKLLTAKSLRGISIPLSTWDNNFKHLGEAEKKEKENQFKSKIMQDYKDFFSNEENEKTLFTIYKKILYAQTRTKPSYDENLPEDRILSIDDWDDLIETAKKIHPNLFDSIDVKNVSQKENELFNQLEVKAEDNDDDDDGFTTINSSISGNAVDQRSTQKIKKTKRGALNTYNTLVQRLATENNLTPIAVVTGFELQPEFARVFEDKDGKYYIVYFPGANTDTPRDDRDSSLKTIINTVNHVLDNNHKNQLDPVKLKSAKKYYLVTTDKRAHFTAVVPHKNGHQLINSQPGVYGTSPDTQYLAECGIEIQKTLNTNTQWNDWDCSHRAVEAILIANRDQQKADYTKIDITDEVVVNNMGYDSDIRLGKDYAPIDTAKLDPINLTLTEKVTDFTEPKLIAITKELNHPKDERITKTHYFNFSDTAYNSQEKRKRPQKSEIIFLKKQDIDKDKKDLYQHQLRTGANFGQKNQIPRYIKRLEFEDGIIGYQLNLTTDNFSEKLTLLFKSASAHNEGLSLEIPEGINTFEFLSALKDLLQDSSYQIIPAIFIKLSDKQQQHLTHERNFQSFEDFFKSSQTPVILNKGYLSAPALAAKKIKSDIKIAEVFNPKNKKSSLNHQQLQQNFSPENNAEWFSPHNYCSVDTPGDAKFLQNPVKKFNTETEKYQYYFLVMSLKKYFSETTGIHYRLKPADVKLSKHRIKLCDLVMDFIAQEKTLDELKKFMKDLGDAAQSKTKIRDSRFKKIMDQLIVDSQQINEKRDKNSILFQKINREIEWAKPENTDQKILADKISAIWVKTWFPMPPEYQCPNISNIKKITDNENPAELNSLTAICQNTYSWIERFSFGARLEGMRELRNCVEKKLFPNEPDAAKQELINNLLGLKFLLENMSVQKILKNDYLEQMRSALGKHTIDDQITDANLADIFIDCRKIAEKSLSSWLHNQSSTFGHYFDQNRGRSKEVHKLYKAFKNTCLINTSPNVVENFNFQTLTIAIQNLAQSVKIPLRSNQQAESEDETSDSVTCLV